MDRAILSEILGDAELYTKSQQGPNGPWTWETLVVRRIHNRILVSDIDGVRLDEICVADIPNGDAAYSHLAERLDQLNTLVRNDL